MIFFIFLLININSTQSLSPIRFKKYISLNSKNKEIIPILNTMEHSCLRISKLIRSNLNLNNELSSTNIHNEKQQAIDLISNNIIKDSLLKLSCVHSIISEEEDHICYNSHNGQYIVAFDPLDGSSNIKSHLPTGTIFGIYTKDTKELISAGYCLYSSSIIFVLSINNVVDMFNYNNKSNKFHLYKSNIKIPDGNIYSFNLGNQKINDMILNNNNPFRYTGALVADAHNILINGGLFGYPTTIKHTNGKLRLLYECKPISKIIVDAGGLAIDGEHNILDLKFENVHERSPIFFGSENQVNKLKKMLVGFF